MMFEGEHGKVVGTDNGIMQFMFTTEQTEYTEGILKRFRFFRWSGYSVVKSFWISSTTGERRYEQKL
ncbi:MAG: hypothetical protein A2X58_12555 [Nitrospirae bacterium GWC2_56_14]|nr:MAG: hypothetical protein A2X58_12555 [Nitrospirae bacterium GWC2_56_14]